MGNDEVPNNSEFFEEMLKPLVKQICELCIEKDIPFVMVFEHRHSQMSNSVGLSANACRWMHELGRIVAEDIIPPQGGTPGTRAWGDIRDF